MYQSLSGNRKKVPLSHRFDQFRNKATSFRKRWIPKRKTREEPKVIVEHGLRKALLRCWVHIIPVLAVIAVAALNFQGYYIGSMYQGSTSSSAQTFDELGLQVAAKILELFITASLGLTVMDIIRYVLIYNDGLPLGIITAQTSVTEVTYFFSSEFWGGVRGLSRTWQRWFIPVYLITVGTIVVLSGPSTAVLVIPSEQSAWPAGSAGFSIVGNSSSNFPTTVDSASIGGDQCDSLQTASFDTTGCPWSGYPVLSAIYSEWGGHFNAFPNTPIGFYEYGMLRQAIQHRRGKAFSPESWTMATSLGTNIWSNSIVAAWWRATGRIPASQMLSSVANFRWTGDGLSARVDGLLPVVRTLCVYNDNGEDDTDLNFPLLSPFETWKGATFSLPREDNVPDDNGNITARWLSMPSGDSPTSDGRTTSVYPSALLTIRVSQGSSRTQQDLISCSIDARWAPGSNVFLRGTGGNDYFYPELDPAHLRSPSNIPDYNNPEFGFLPADDGSWQTISLDLSWLNNLTPPITGAENNSTTTTLTTLLDAMNLSNSTTRNPSDPAHLTPPILSSYAENVIATLVADGLSRIGAYTQATNPSANSASVSVASTKKFLTGAGYTFPAPANVAAENTTELTWSITVSGLAYTADNAASALALALLFVYVAIVAVHTLWVLWHRWASDAWSSAGELLVLAQNSPPCPKVLGGTCAGIEATETWGRRARIRVVGVKGGEEVCLVFESEDEEAGTGMGMGYGRVKEGKAYGRARGGRLSTW
ncbi:hypothetical protein K402DRAFT_453761 [Aulographum hederae CBS 113979]|uniref:Uncharacterized protein n=1 Tax=Aulographum hederae CBS 113979 TaxID=1176131 RepID=A0A6G1H242_9PEZI|nr:hypothetical protein K402DRAFT_453761 [Aulographum hederae CBS 113979]